MASSLNENPAYEPPKTSVQPISQDTVISIPNHTGVGKCPVCDLHRCVQIKRAVSQQQHLLAALGLFCGLCCVPYCISSLKYTKFKCQSCGYMTKDHNKNVALKILLTIIITIFLIVSIIILVRMFKAVEDNESLTEHPQH